jgi:hypothetical protein
MENFSYEPVIYSNSNMITCRKKLNFNDQTNELGVFDVKQNNKKYKKNMAIVAGTVQIQQQNSSNYVKQEQFSTNNNNKLHKIPSNTKRNARERKRVRTINDYFSQLQRFLPFTKQSQSSNVKKLSKVETLKAAIEYIEYLQTFSPQQTSSNTKLVSSISSSPISSTNTTISLSPSSSSSSSSSSLLTSPSTTSNISLNSSISLLSPHKTKLQSTIITTKQCIKSKISKQFQQQQQQAQIEQHNSIASISNVQPNSHSNDIILNQIDYNVNYNANTNNAQMNDSSYYYNNNHHHHHHETQQLHNQQQQYNVNYLNYSNNQTQATVVATVVPNSFRPSSSSSEFCMNSTNNQYYNLECDNLHLHPHHTATNTINSNQITSSSPLSASSPPEINNAQITSSSSIEYNQRHMNNTATNSNTSNSNNTTFNTNNAFGYAPVNYNNNQQESNIINYNRTNTTTNNNSIDYNQINC